MLSVVSITRNNFSELVATVESIKGLSGIELVVVNGGDCPKTKSYLEELPHQVKDIRVVSVTERDHGIADAFNKGIKLSSGDAIVFLNSGDTLYDRGFFERASIYLARHPNIGFVHGSIVFGDKLAGDIELKPSLSSLGKGMPYRHQTMVVRKQVFQQLGLFRTDLKVTMDYEFVCRMHKAGVKGYYDQTGPLVKMDGGGISSTKEMQAYNEVLAVLWQHGLFTIENIYGCLVRYFKYFVRMTLVHLGLTGLLAKLKHSKHGRVAGASEGADKTRLRIGVALDTLHRYGGLTRSSWELSQCLSLDHDVVFLTTQAELTGTERFFVKILKVTKIPYLKKILFAWKVSRQKRYLKLDILNVHGSNGFWQDVVTAQSVHKKWFFWSLQQTPFLSWPWIRKVANPIHYLTIAMETIQYSRFGSKRVIAISHQVKRDLVHYFAMNPEKIDVVHHGVNTLEFDPSRRQIIRNQVRKDHGIAAERKVIIFAAHEFRRKGLSVLLEAVAKAQDQNSVLLVAGQDDPAPFYDQIRKLNLPARVKFLGRQNNMSDWYAASDVFAFPTSYEAFGMVITEAMAAGLPVIVPRDAGAAELVTHNVDGLLMQQWNDVDELVDCLNILDDPITRMRIGSAARLRTEACTWGDAAQLTLKTYRSILLR